MIVTRRLPSLLAAFGAAALSTTPVLAQLTADAPGIRPDAIVDLASDEGVALVRGQWRYTDARVIEAEHSNDIEPRAGAASGRASTRRRRATERSSSSPTPIPTGTTSPRCC